MKYWNGSTICKKKKKKCSKIDISKFCRIPSDTFDENFPLPRQIFTQNIFQIELYTTRERIYPYRNSIMKRTYFAQRKLCQRMNNNRSPVYSKLANILINITPISPFLPSLVRDNFNCALDTDSRKQNFHLPWKMTNARRRCVVISCGGTLKRFLREKLKNLL